MATISINGSNQGNALQEILQSDDIQPGYEPSYEICKLIYVYHVLGRKLVDKPIEMAQSQPRTIAIPDSPEERVRDAFLKQWEKDGCDDHIANFVGLSRVYGISSLALLENGQPTDKPLALEKLWQREISFNVFDPLNTAGSLVLNQTPNAMDFQHVTDIRVSGQTYHRSRSCVIMNEKPIYIQYTQSAFGFVGRSVYQRTLYPLKSYLQTMVTNDLVTKKAGLLVAMMKTIGSVVDNVMSLVAGQKRQMLQQGQSGNVLTIGADEKIETLNMQNTDNAMTTARTNILHDIAAGADMPAKVMTQESFAEGFGEGSEDMREIARFVKRQREKMARPYAWMDRIEQHRAWNPEFYATIQQEFPEYRSIKYEQAFYRWQNSFSAIWPSFLEEPDSEKVKVDDVKLKAIIAFVQVLMPELDPENKATLVQWAADNLNEMEFLFSNPLVLDTKALAEYVPPMQLEEPKPGHPFAAQDAMAAYSAAVDAMIGRRNERREPEADKIVQILAQRRRAR
jgi:hypothetical protein